MPLVALSFGLLMLGASAILVRLAGVPGVVAAFYRTFVAVVVVTPLWLGRSARPRFRSRSMGVGVALVGGLLFAADLAAWSTGVVLSGATNPTLMANTAPLWVGVGAWLIFKERQPWRFWLGLIVAMGGAVVVLGLDAVRSIDLGAGTFLGLLAGVFYGGYFLVTQRGRARMDAVSYFWFSGAASSAGLGLMVWLFDQPLTGHSLNSYAYLAALALGPQLLGWLAINYAQGHLPASVVSPTLLGQPVVTALLAGPVLGEQLQAGQVVGGLAVLSGVFLVHRSRMLRKPVPAERA